MRLRADGGSSIRHAALLLAALLSAPAQARDVDDSIVGDFTGPFSGFAGYIACDGKGRTGIALNESEFIGSPAVYRNSILVHEHQHIRFLDLFYPETCGGRSRGYIPAPRSTFHKIYGECMAVRVEVDYLLAQGYTLAAMVQWGRAESMYGCIRGPIEAELRRNNAAHRHVKESGGAARIDFAAEPHPRIWVEGGTDPREF